MVQVVWEVEGERETMAEPFFSDEPGERRPPRHPAAVAPSVSLLTLM